MCEESAIHSVSVVIPVYKGRSTLATVVNELIEVDALWQSVDISEIILVHDCGPDHSDAVIRELADSHPRVRAVWLTRNYGQHGATLAGMGASTQEWVVTMDEDGQHDPRFIPALITRAVATQTPVVYGYPTNPPSHGRLRNWASRSAKSLVARATGIEALRQVQSYRLLTGDIARSAARLAGPGAYLDVVVSWIASGCTTEPTVSRTDGRPSGYGLRKLASHFWRLVTSSGTRPLRGIAILGTIFAIASVAVAIAFAADRLLGADFPPGFAAIIVSSLLSAGAILISLGVIAEYLGSLINVALGRPPYIASDDRALGPLGKQPPT